MNLRYVAMPGGRGATMPGGNGTTGRPAVCALACSGCCLATLPFAVDVGRARVSGLIPRGLEARHSALCIPAASASATVRGDAGSKITFVRGVSATCFGGAVPAMQAATAAAASGSLCRRLETFVWCSCRQALACLMTAPWTGSWGGRV
eukprot:SAG11_NODE_1274_length_5330_cov_5.595106_1_plen_149_part_00